MVIEEVVISNCSECPYYSNDPRSWGFCSKVEDYVKEQNIYFACPLKKQCVLLRVSDE